MRCVNRSEPTTVIDPTAQSKSCEAKLISSVFQDTTASKTVLRFSRAGFAQTKTPFL